MYVKLGTYHTVAPSTAKLRYIEFWYFEILYRTTVNGPATINANKCTYMAYFEHRIHQAVNADPLRFDIMKFCCIHEEVHSKGYWCKHQLIIFTYGLESNCSRCLSLVNCRIY